MNAMEIITNHLEWKSPDREHLDIVRDYLEDDEYDGLCTENCGCLKDDLAPCGNENFWSCVPGYKVPCPGGDECPAEGDCPWHISTEKLIEQGNHE